MGNCFSIINFTNHIVESEKNILKEKDITREEWFKIVGISSK
jgi:hypothetical protein